MKIYKQGEYTIAQDEKRAFAVVEKNQNFYKLDDATFDSMFHIKSIIFKSSDKMKNPVNKWKCKNRTDSCNKNSTHCIIAI